MSGLTLITVPIGNIRDITFRAREALELNTHFLAEDTRVFRKLLEELDINSDGKTIISFHEHNQHVIDSIILKIINGQKFCLVSDAGSPIISDPAYPLIKKIKENNLVLNTIPGVTSVITALELSGLPATPFHFWGFISKNRSEKKDFFKNCNFYLGTHIFFDSPRRILDSVEVFFEVHPEGEVILTRELTKKFESIYSIRKNDLVNLPQIVNEKGEFVALFHNSKDSTFSINDNDELKKLVKEYLDSKGTTKVLAKIFSKILNEDTKSIYGRLIESE